MIEYGKVARPTGPTGWSSSATSIRRSPRALAGAKLGMRAVHLEAGLRSRDRTMPEEINRLATDAVCDVLWTPSPDADANLIAEGIPAARIARVGNIMLDSFERRGRRSPRPACPRARPRRRRLWRGHAAPAVQRRRFRRSSRRLAASLIKVQRAPAAGLPGPSPHRRAARRGGPRQEARSGGRAPDRAAPLHPLHEPGRRRRRGDHRFRRLAGGNHLSRHSLLHAAREYRAADHHRARARTAWRPPASLPACSSDALGRDRAPRRAAAAGTARPPAAASPTSGAGPARSAPPPDRISRAPPPDDTEKPAFRNGSARVALQTCNHSVADLQ